MRAYKLEKPQIAAYINFSSSVLEAHGCVVERWQFLCVTSRQSANGDRCGVQKCFVVVGTRLTSTLISLFCEICGYSIAANIANYAALRLHGNKSVAIMLKKTTTKKRWPPRLFTKFLHLQCAAFFLVSSLVLRQAHLCIQTVCENIFDCRLCQLQESVSGRRDRRDRRDRRSAFGGRET